MARENVYRRLTAVVNADVVGYSRLMGIDEAKTRSAAGLVVGVETG